MRNVGKFKVKGTQLLVTDPCYTRGTWCQGVVKNVKPGEWQALVDDSQDRIGMLLVEHMQGGMAGPWELLDADIGVDSGQAGVFALSSYPKGETGEYGEKDTFYGQCCELTLSGERAGVLKDGAVSSSGYGDGSYTAYVSKNGEGKVTAIKVVFIDDDEETCGECGEPADDTYDGLCSDCRANRTERCDGCRSIFDTDELENGLCPACAEEESESMRNA